MYIYIVCLFPGEELSNQLSTWLNQAPINNAPARAIIAPQVFISFSGQFD